MKDGYSKNASILILCRPIRHTEGSQLTIVFLYNGDLDEFFEQYHLKDIQFPAAFSKRGEIVTLLIDSEDQQFKDVQGLMNLVKSRRNQIKSNRGKLCKIKSSNTKQGS